MNTRFVRLVALGLLVVLAVTCATPSRAEADLVLALGIGSLVVAGATLIVYLIIANIHHSRTAETDAPLRLACAESETTPQGCWPLDPQATPATDAGVRAAESVQGL